MSKRKMINKRKQCVCFPENFKTVAFSPKLNDFRLGGILCDGIIHCADHKSIKIHRAILSTASPYFEKVFENTLSRAENEKNETSVDISSYFLNILLDFAYTGSCKITAENVEELLIYSDRFEVAGVIQLCCQYLIAQLNPRNCFYILKFAKDYFCQGLEKRGKLYIRHNFTEIILNPEAFNKLTVTEVKDILGDDELNVRRERTVLQAIKTWVKHDPNNRVQHLSSLLSCVRYDQKYNSRAKLLDRVLKWNCVKTNETWKRQAGFRRGMGCTDQIFSLRSIAEKTLAKSQKIYCAFVDLEKAYDRVEFYVRLINEAATQLNDNANITVPLSRPRFPHEVLFAVGGWGVGSPTSFIETYDVRANKWFPSSFLDAPRAYHGVCALDMLVYIIGGFDGSNHFNTMRCFNPVTKIWNERACMYQARCYVSVAVLGGKIYALGGFNGMSRLSSAERYCPRQNQWEMIAPMNKHRSDASATAFQGKIYIVGGINGQEILTSGEVFDPASNQWTSIMPMSSPRSGVSLVAYAGCLYALGGFNGYIRLNTCEKMDPVLMTGWETVTSMAVARSNFAAVVLDDKIFVIGGFNGAATIPTVETYDREYNEWSEMASMNLNRSALSACVIPGLPNAREFSFLYHSAPEEGASTSGSCS